MTNRRPTISQWFHPASALNSTARQSGDATSFRPCSRKPFYLRCSTGNCLEDPVVDAKILPPATLVLPDPRPNRQISAKLQEAPLHR